MHGHICLTTHLGVRVWASYMRMSNLVSMFVYIFVHVSVYVFMCRHVYVYEYDSFMYVHMSAYCICMYVITLFSAARTPLVSNCTI